ncbi:MAG: GNAT family N-acetyltransferase [Acidimicrobiia bacterium]
MGPTSRPATRDDLSILESLYFDLAAEMDAIKPIWSSADGLPHPVIDSFESLLGDPTVHLYLGEIDKFPVGFLMARDEALLPQAGGRRVAAVRLIFTLAGARGVGVGEAMIARFLQDAEGRGIHDFDAHVSPGHRASKNFFESNGFKARSIVMHRSDG